MRELAATVRGRVVELEPAVNAVWQALQRHGDDLGLDVHGTRTATAAHAADLLARLSAARDNTDLVRVLATVDGGPADAKVGSAIASAPAVLAALDGVDWPLLGSVRGLADHEVLGERAQRLVDDVADTARADQYDRDLVPVLGRIRREAVHLASEAARLAAVVRPDPSRTVEDRPVPGRPVTDPVDRLPPGPTPPRPGPEVRRRVVDASTVGAALADLQAELRRRPGARVELTWRPLDGPER